MISKVISIICYVAAGFFVYAIGLMSFINMDAVSPTAPGWAMLVMMSMFTIPLAISLLLGMALVRFNNWKRDLGIVIVSGATFTVFAALSVFCIVMSPETARLYPGNKLSIFSGYATGIGFLALCYAAGIFLIISALKHKKISEASTGKL